MPFDDRVVKSHRLIVAWPCLSFTATMKRGSTECQRLCALARIDNTRRSSRAETNPSSYGTRLIDRHLPRPPVPSARVSRPAPRGGRSPRKPGSPEPTRQIGEHRDARRISSDPYEHYLILLPGMNYIRPSTFRITKLFHAENIAAGIYAQHFCITTDSPDFFIAGENKCVRWQVIRKLD